MKPRRYALAFLVSGLLAGLSGCTSSDDPDNNPDSEQATRTEAEPDAALELSPCRGDDLPDGFGCGELTVPVDHADPDGRTLALAVIVQDGAADDPVLLNLTGGPGQPGVSFAGAIAEGMAPVLEGRRLVMFDQRGTGGTAIDCPGLQAEMGWNDLTRASEAAVGECSDLLGADRAFYGSQDTVDDIEVLRQALGVDTMTLDGTSYGTYVAERYAVTYPDRVDHLILDSVVPHTWTDDGSLQLANIHGVRRVLALVCRDARCDTDPLADLATLIDNGDDGPELMNLMAVITVASGTDMGFVPGMLHDAVEGDRGDLDGWLGGVAEDPPVDEYSAGLHAATVCLDQHLPWGDSATPLDEREDALARTAAALSERETYPYDPQTVIDQGLVGECVDWGQTPPDEESDARELPDVPTLFLIGDHDLSTSWEWARQEVRVAPDPTVMVVKGAGHGVQRSAGEFPEVLTRIESFLAS
jgi:pimeloyl-ACP methyl ester carboxylesterase